MNQNTYDKLIAASSKFDEAKHLYLNKKQELSDIVNEVTIQEIQSSLLNFYKDLEKLDYILTLNLKQFNTEKKENLKKFKAFVRSKKIKIKDKKYSIPAKHLEQFDFLYNSYKNVDDYIFSTYKSFIINATSLFDAYILSTINRIKTLKPNLFYNSFKDSKDKLFTYVDIFDNKFTTSDYDQKHITKHLMSDNRIKQMKWLLSLIGIRVKNILNDKDSMKEFIRFTEIRNLLVHNQGKINSKFLNNLKDNEIEISSYKLHSTISINEKEIILFKNILIRIIATLNNHICYYINTDLNQKICNLLDDLSLRLIKNKDFLLCKQLIEDYMEFKNKSDSLEEALLINLGQIYKCKGYSNKLKNTCKKIKSNDDITLLCKSILLDDNDLIYEKTKTANIPKSYFYTWPIFQFVKRNSEFLKAFKEKYKESYSDEIIEKDDFN